MLKYFLKNIYFRPKTIYELSVWLYLHNKIKESNLCSGFFQELAFYKPHYFQKIKAFQL
jgi:hypothetical protein